MKRIEATGCRVQSGNRFCTGGCLLRISNFGGDPLFERLAVLTVGHAFRDDAIPVEVLIRGRRVNYSQVPGSIRLRTNPGPRAVVDAALCDVTSANSIIAGLRAPGNLTTPRSDLLIKDDAEDRRLGYLLREESAGNERFVISDYFPVLEIPQLGRLHSMVRAEADSKVFVGGTSGAAWCVKTETGQFQPVAMQIAEADKNTIGYGQSYFSIVVEWLGQRFPGKKIQIRNVIDSQV